MGDHHYMQHTFSLPDIHLLDPFPGPNPYLQSPIEFSSFPQFPPNNFTTPATATTPITAPDISRKRKATDPPETTPANTSAHKNSNNNNRIRKTKKVSSQRSGKGKKAKTDEDEKQREVVHVRARRGQATDRHSLAERVRRKKIKERLRCLQDIVPGCYKTMGMAVMLDEIINYVQSLQTQVEFLSTRLATAGAFDPSSNPFETVQIANAFEELNFENVGIEGLDFGYCSQLPPHNT